MDNGITKSQTELLLNNRKKTTSVEDFQKQQQQKWIVHVTKIMI